MLRMIRAAMYKLFMLSKSIAKSDTHFLAKRITNTGAKTVELTPQQRQIRMAVRNFLLPATREQMVKELEISLERNDMFRAKCVQECIDEHDKERG